MTHDDQREGSKHEEHTEPCKEPLRRDTKVPEHKPRQDNVLSIEESSDEGWQEASFRGKSNYLRRKTGSRRQALSKLALSNSESYATVTVGYKTRTISPCCKSNSSETLPKASPANGTRSEKYLKALGMSRLSAVTSKFVSYKEVAVSPPGSILKPITAQIVDVKDDSNDAHEHNYIREKEVCKDLDLEESPSEVSEKETCLKQAAVGQEKPSDSSDKIQDFSDSKKVEASNSRLSASAPPFNPESLPSASHLYRPIALGSMYKTTNSQLRLHLEIPCTESVYLRVPRGPRSSVYNSRGHSFRRKAGCTTCENTSESIMNPNAAEFVPAKEKNAVVGIDVAQPPENAIQQASTDVVENETYDTSFSQENVQVDKVDNGSIQKTKLARQILLNLVVKSFQHGLISSSEANDTSAQAKSEHTKNEEKDCPSSNNVQF